MQNAVLLIFVIIIIVCFYMNYYNGKNIHLEGFNKEEKDLNKCDTYCNLKDIISKEENENIQKIFNKKELLNENEIEIINSYAKIIRNETKNKNKKFNIIISAIYCDEDDYLKEWLDYHLNKLNIIDHIYLYSNCNNFNSYNILKPYIDNGSVTLIIYNHISKSGIGLIKRKPQYFSLVHNYNNFKNEYNYIFHFDIDEFLYVKNETELLNYIKSKENNVGNFMIKRLNFSGNNHKAKQQSVLNSYFYREKNPSSYKSIANKNNIIKKSANKLNFTDTNAQEPEYIGTCHEFFTNLKSEYVPIEICQLNHYMLKSKAEYINRRGNADVRKSTPEQWENLNKKFHIEKDMKIINYLKNN
jgi:hypothetical protein